MPRRLRRGMLIYNNTFVYESVNRQIYARIDKNILRSLQICLIKLYDKIHLVKVVLFLQ